MFYGRKMSLHDRIPQQPILKGKRSLKVNSLKVTNYLLHRAGGLTGITNGKIFKVINYDRQTTKIMALTAEKDQGLKKQLSGLKQNYQFGRIAPLPLKI